MVRARLPSDASEGEGKVRRMWRLPRESKRGNRQERSPSGRLTRAVIKSDVATCSLFPCLCDPQNVPSTT